MSTFLSHWRQFFQAATDASHEYAEAAGLACLSAIALGRRRVAIGSGVYPNLFMLLVGPSSVGRKSTSIAYAQKMIDLVDPSRVGPNTFTTAGLREWMKVKDENTGKSRTRLMVFNEEFSTALDTALQFDPLMASTLCALYDGNDWREARKLATGVILGPQVGIFSAAAFAMLSTRLRTKDWESGFLMRFLYVDPKHVRPRQYRQPAHPTQLWDAATASLQHILFSISQNPTLALDFEPAAADLYDEIVQQYDQDALQFDDIAHTYIGRFGVILAKLALLYQMDENPQAPISVASMTAADQFARLCWRAFLKVRVETTQHEFEGLLVAVLDWLRKIPPGQPFPKNDLWTPFRSAQNMPRVWSTLLMSGLLVEDRQNRTCRIVGAV